ncbi:MipA/OmpV family protein [Thalassotalea euphylliae]|uniref:MipA/OmpV family protein n=1 Tax=Thalassotalea euphylliae TaxID=1655234 RepID=UPI003636A9F3
MALPFQAVIAEDAALIETESWHFSVAIGGGLVSNPVVDGDNLPLIVIPNLSYYGDQFFFDNGLVGYSFIQAPTIEVSIASKINSTAAYFKDWNTESWLITSLIPVSDGSSGSNVKTLAGAIEDTGVDKISSEDIRDRRWSLDTGIQVNWFASDSIDVIANYYLDTTGVHHGENALVEVTKRFVLSKEARLQLGLGLHWQSAQLSNYYFGIHPEDGHPPSALYLPGDTLNQFIQVQLARKINENWRFIFTSKLQRLDEKLKRSPIVEESKQYSVFMGAVYDF